MTDNQNRVFIITEQQANIVFTTLGELPGKVGFTSMNILNNLPVMPMPKKADPAPEQTPTESEPKAETVATAEPGNGRSPKKA